MTYSEHELEFTFAKNGTTFAACTKDTYVHWFGVINVLMMKMSTCRLLVWKRVEYTIAQLEIAGGWRLNLGYSYDCDFNSPHPLGGLVISPASTADV